MLGVGAKFVHGFREFTRKYLQVVALFDQDGDVALKFLARSSHAATSSRLSKEIEERSAFPRPFHGSRRESPQVFGNAPFLENCVDHTMRRWSQFDWAIGDPVCEPAWKTAAIPDMRFRELMT